MENNQIVYKIISKIPKGSVLTYKLLAEIAGIKNPRVVGNILHKNPAPNIYPCHRVVNINGGLAVNYAFGGKMEQYNKLKAENVKFISDKVDLKECLWQPSVFFKKYFQLLKEFGEPGPWPWFGQDRSRSVEEIVIGAILTQNTNWKNVTYAMGNLSDADCCSLEGISKLIKTDFEKLKKLIQPSGFYNQKAEYLKTFCIFINQKYQTLDNFFKLSLKTARKELLSLKGIGLETADTVLLYAGQKPIFVIDAYTKKFTNKHQLADKLDYDYLQKIFTLNLPQDIDLYQDFHALIVRWGKIKDKCLP